MQELREAMLVAEIIEDYPDDKYGASCLVLDYTQAHRPLHVQCSYPSRPLLKIVTFMNQTETVDRFKGEEKLRMSTDIGKET